MKPYQFWTPEETRTLITMHTEGVAINEIAVRLNRTPKSVKSKLDRIKKDFKENTIDSLNFYHEDDKEFTSNKIFAVILFVTAITAIVVGALIWSPK
jgi:hypothetical protein